MASGTVQDRQATTDTYDGGDSALMIEARERFKRGKDFESEWRTLALRDMKFNLGDSDNQWQWPDEVREAREISKRPRLTVNKTASIVREIVNNGHRNRPGLKVDAVGGGASVQAARLYQGLFRSIENESNAQAIYDQALRDLTEAGSGFWRITTAYYDSESFDQSIRIRPIHDVLSVIMDCDVQEYDSSDAMWCFLYRDWARKEFERRNPTIDLPPEALSRGVGLDEGTTWVTADNVRESEYYRIVVTDDVLYEITEPSGVATFRQSETPRRMREIVERIKDKADPQVIYKSRPVQDYQLEWFKIMGDQVVDRRTKASNNPLRGRYIPVIRAPGRERVIDGQLHRKGLVRDLKDVQRMYNYNTSGECEVVALQTKTPYVAAAEAIEGNQGQWFNLNVQNPPVLVYKAFNDNGDQIPPPQRQEPPTPSQAFLEGIRIANSEFELASGIHMAQQENPSLERTPRAIEERTYKGEVAAQDLYDSIGYAIVHSARVIIDLAPHIYDTQRIAKIMADDGSFQDVSIDPGMKDQAYREEKEKEGDTLKVFFNPAVGRYAVVPDVGPSYQTRRKEAWNAFAQIMMANETLTGLIGDLAFKNADFEGAELIAERMKKALQKTQPWLFDQGPTPETAEMQKALQKAIQDNEELLEKLATEKLKVAGKDEMRDIDWYRAYTERLSAEGNAVADMSALDATGGLKMLIRQTFAEMIGFDADRVAEADKKARAMEPKPEPKGNGSATNQ